MRQARMEERLQRGSVVDESVWISSALGNAEVPTSSSMGANGL